jgi:hypothetical protein
LRLQRGVLREKQRNKSGEGIAALQTRPTSFVILLVAG